MVVAKMRLRIAMLCFVASLRLGLTAFVLPLGSHQRATSGLRAAVCRQSPSTSVLNRVLRLRWRGAPSGLISGTMQVQVEQDFNQPSVNTLVVKPHRGAVSAAAPFPSTHANTERTQEPPLPQKILDSESEAPELRMRMSRAKELIASGKFEAAEELLADTCTEFPNSGKLWMKRFKLARRQRLYGKARKVLQMALKHNPLNAILWQAWADLERSLGRVNVARNLYKKGLEANPWLASLYNSWGSMERNLGRVDMARRLFKEGLKHDGNSVRLLLSWGVMEDVDGNAELARSLLRRGLLVEPGNSFLLHALGMLDFKAGNVAGAREAFGTAVGVDGNHTQTWLALARLEESQGNIAVARKHYVSGCKSHCGRGTVQLWQAWARMEEKEGNSRAALDVYRKAILLFAADSQLLVECAKVLTKMGNVQEAEKLLGRALKGDPHNPYIYQCLATLELKQQKIEEARALYATGVAMAEQGLSRSLGDAKGAGRKLTEAGAGSALEHRGKGGAAMRGGATMGARELGVLLHMWATVEQKHGGDVNATRALFAKATALDAERGFMWRSFAGFEAQHGDPLVARHYFARAVNAEPHDGESWVQWAALEQDLGNDTRAAFYARRGAELQGARQVRNKLHDAKRPLARKWDVGKMGGRGSFDR